MTTRDENRAAIWGLLAQHGSVTWHGYGQDVAFADEVLDLAARLGRVETVPAMRPTRVATEQERKARISEVATRLGWPTNGLRGPESDSDGSERVPVTPGRQRGADGDE